MLGETVTLWRPVGPKELKLIEESGMRAFPPRLPEQPIFYPVLSEEYAIKIARDWNVPASGAGFVTRFRVSRAFLDRHAPQAAGGRAHLEYWIPAEDLPAFNDAIVGPIEVIAEFRRAGPGLASPHQLFALPSRAMMVPWAAAHSFSSPSCRL